MKNKGIPGVLGKHPKISLAIIAAAGLTLLSNVGNGRTTECQTYQGYHDVGEHHASEYIHVFDGKTLHERTGNPAYSLPGGPFFRGNLKIGEQYRLRIVNPFIGGEFIVSAEPCRE